MKIDELSNLILVWGAISDNGLLYLNDKKGDNFSVLVPENRPSMIGLNYNIPHLKKARIPFVYCTDNMLGILFYKSKIKETILFYKELRENGLIATSGSLFAVYLSSLHNILVKASLEGEFNPAGFDKDASTLRGKKFLLAGQEKFVYPAKDELVERNLINEYLDQPKKRVLR